MAPGSSYTSADTLNILTGPYTGIYYWRSGHGWRSSLSVSADAGPTPLPMGGSFVISRSQAGTFTWTEPAPY